MLNQWNLIQVNSDAIFNLGGLFKRYHPVHCNIVMWVIYE